MSESQEAEKELVETENTQTPPEVEASEQVATKPEKPAEPDSGEQAPEQVPQEAGQAAEVPPEKTPEQLEADRAFFQRKAQEEQAAKKEALDQLEALQSASPQGEAAPAVEEKPATKTQPTVQPGPLPGSMTDEQLNEFLQDNPIELARAIRQGTAETVISILDEREKEQNIANEKQSIANESFQTDKVLKQFADKHGIPQENIMAELESLKSQGILGRPSAMGRLVIDRLNLAKSKEIGQQQVEKAKADAAQAVTTQLLTVQPEGGGKVPTSEAKTREEAISDRFGPTKARGKEEKLLSGEDGGF